MHDKHRWVVFTRHDGLEGPERHASWQQASATGW